MTKALLILATLPLVAAAESYEEGMNRLEKLHQRTQGLLDQAGVPHSSRASQRSEKEERPRILKVQELPSSAFLAPGALAFGKTYLRLLVGGEGSPLEAIVEESRYPFLQGARVLGTATQVRGRIFGDFDRLLLRSGKVIPIQATLLDSSGALGVKGENENSKSLEVAGGVALGLLASPKDTTTAFSFAQEARESTGQRLRNSLLHESRDYLRNKFKESSVLRLNENTAVVIRFQEGVKF